MDTLTRWLGDIFGTALDVAKLLKNDTVVKLLTERGLKEVAELHLYCAHADDTFFALASTAGRLSYILYFAPSADNAFFTLVQQVVSHGVFPLGAPR
jgi:hypothetical protein